MEIVLSALFFQVSREYWNSPENADNTLLEVCARVVSQIEPNELILAVKELWQEILSSDGFEGKSGEAVLRELVSEWLAKKLEENPKIWDEDQRRCHNPTNSGAA